MNSAPGANTIATARTSGWALAFAAYAVAVVLLLGCFWRTLESLVGVWSSDGTYQYAFLIFPVSLWVAFNLRDRLRARRPVPSVWGLVAVVGLACIWYVGQLLDVNLVRHFAFVALFPALVLACWGWRALWVLIFPLVYLVVFAVPWGDGLVGPLQDFTAHFAVHALDITGTPVLLNGREIITSAATWMVADACSGVKFFIACSALGCLYAYLMYQRWWKRLLFVALAGVIPVIANGFRVYFTVLIGDTWGLEYATGTDHLIFGWQFFGTVLVLLLLGGWFFRDPPPKPESLPVDRNKVSGIRTVVWPVAWVLLMAGPIVAVALASPAMPVGQLTLVAPTLVGWTGSTAAGDWQPSFSGAAGQIRAAYRPSADAGDTVELFHAVYTGKPRRGHSLITFGNNVYDPDRSHILASSAHNIVFADGRGVVAGELRVSGDSGARLVWYWYCVDHRCTSSRTQTKLLQAWDVLRGRSPRSAVWALSAPVANGDAERVRRRLSDFARALPAAGTLVSGDEHGQVATEVRP